MRRWWRFSLRAMLLFVLVCAVVCALVSWWLRPEVLHPGYFPIGVGYRWVYSAEESHVGNDVVFEVVGTEKIGAAECFVVLRSIGDHRIKFYVEVDDRGVLVHQVGEDRYRPAYRQFAFDTKQGDRWDWRGKIGEEAAEYWCLNYGVQRVSVPLGEWDAFWVAQESLAADHADTRFWLVEGIGVVRLSAKSRDKHDPPAAAGESSNFDWRLKEFSRR